jgi:predicted enzyme related to lactoylglutathione lyase
MSITEFRKVRIGHDGSMSTVSKPTWIDLVSPTGRDVITFYESVCGWTAAESSDAFGGYWMFFADGVPVAGARPGNPGEEPVWRTYLSVTDAQVTHHRALELGAVSVVPPVPVGDLGVMSIFTDPAGNTTGLWQAGEFAGFVSSPHPGIPSWFEVYAKDYQGTQDFYRALVAWQPQTMSDTESFRYVTVSDESGPFLGMMDFSDAMHAAMPAYWNVYIAVPDCASAVSNVRAHGGEILMDASPTPLGVMAAVRDPNGAVFSLLQTAE